MRHRFAAVVLAVLHGAVVLGPAVVVAGAARRGGLAWAHGLDLAAASAVVAAVHGALVWRRVRRAPGGAPGVRDAALASLNALVVLALLTTVLLFVVLGGLVPQHAAALDEGWHVLATWTLLQVLAVSATGGVSRGLRWWLRRAARGGQPVRAT